MCWPLANLCSKLPIPERAPRNQTLAVLAAALLMRLLVLWTVA